MSVLLNRIIDYMDIWAKPELIDSWDRSGFQLGNRHEEIKKVIVSLDLDREVLDYSIENDIDLIISHHPLIFSPLESITGDNYEGRLIQDLIRNGINSYSCHSNLDQSPKGVSYYLAKALDIKDLEILVKTTNIEARDYGYGQVGFIDETSLGNYLVKIKNALSLDKVKFYGDPSKTIKKVAVCGGSGASFIEEAKMAGADLYITGDIKYHEAQLGHQLDLALVDGGHYETERFILEEIKTYLQREFKDLEIKVFDRPSPSYSYY